MVGLAPAIHVLLLEVMKGVDARRKFPPFKYYGATSNALAYGYKEE